MRNGAALHKERPFFTSRDCLELLQKGKCIPGTIQLQVNGFRSIVLCS